MAPRKLTPQLAAKAALLLTPAELDMLTWAVDGAEAAHDDDPEEFPWPPDLEDLVYRIEEQAPEMGDTEAERRGQTRIARSLLKKLDLLDT